MTPTKFHTLLELIPGGWPPYAYLLCGSASLAVRGIRDVHDLDLLVHESLWAEAQQAFLPYRDVAKHAAYDQAAADAGTSEPSEPQQSRLICTTLGLDLFSEMPRVASCLDYETAWKAGTVYRHADRAHRVISLRHTLAIKALAYRFKDFDDMKTLAELIAAEENDL